jgi:hypothetical protein
VLDVREDADRMVVAVEKAETAREILGYEGVDYRIVDLNLDEIFEAYVVGRRDDEIGEPQASTTLQNSI